MYKKLLVLFLVLSLTACNTGVAVTETTIVNMKNEETTAVEMTTEKEMETAVNAEIETSEKSESETEVVDKWADYSEEVKAIIKKYDGKMTCEIWKNITKEEANKLAEEGVYLVGFNTHGKEELESRDVNGGVLKAMTWDEAEQYALDWFNNHKTNEVLEVGDKEYVLEPFAYKREYLSDQSPVANARKLYINNKENEAYTQRQEYLKQFILKNETAGSPAKYINALGGREYFRDEVSGNVYTKDGQREGFDGYYGTEWCKSRGVNPGDYANVEELVFKKNNPDIKFTNVHYKDNIKYKVYTHGGFVNWIERDRNAYAYTAFGLKVYPEVYKSFDRYLPYCGGTKVNGDVVAFRNFDNFNRMGDVMYNWYYNGVVEDGEGSPYELSVRGTWLVDNVDTNPYK